MPRLAVAALLLIVLGLAGCARRENLQESTAPPPAAPAAPPSELPKPVAPSATQAAPSPRATGSRPESASPPANPPPPAGAAAAPGKDLSGADLVRGILSPLQEIDAAYTQAVATVRQSPVGPNADHAQADRAVADFSMRLIGAEFALHEDMERHTRNARSSRPLFQHAANAVREFHSTAELLKSYVASGNKSNLTAAEKHHAGARAHIDALAHMSSG
jgi:hypothetical protein